MCDTSFILLVEKCFCASVMMVAAETLMIFIRGGKKFEDRSSDGRRSPSERSGSPRCSSDVNDTAEGGAPPQQPASGKTLRLRRTLILLSHDARLVLLPAPSFGLSACLYGCAARQMMWNSHCVVVFHTNTSKAFIFQQTERQRLTFLTPKSKRCMKAPSKLWKTAALHLP